MCGKSTERRRHPRFKLVCPGRLLTEEGQLLATTRTMDVSDGGALLQVAPETPLAIGDRICVELDIPASADGTPARHVVARARIVRKIDSEFPYKMPVAVEFCEPLDPPLTAA